jgi:hypothetical protein
MLLMLRKIGRLVKYMQRKDYHLLFSAAIRIAAMQLLMKLLKYWFIYAANSDNDVCYTMTRVIEHQRVLHNDARQCWKVGWKIDLNQKMLMLILLLLIQLD